MAILASVALGDTFRLAAVPGPPPSAAAAVRRIHRRGAAWELLAGLAVSSQIAKPCSAAETPEGAAWEASVGAGQAYASIGAALSATPKGARGARLRLGPGTYREQVVVEPSMPVTLDVQPPGSATLVWETNRPYEAALAVRPGARASVRGLRIRHAGKSVANNYAVSSEGGELELEDCDVSSSTGAGVAAEGGRLSIRGGSVHDCARQGLVLLGPLLGPEPLRADVAGTSLRGNGNYLGDGDAIRGPFDGVLARSGVEAELRAVEVEGSGGVGVAAYEDARLVLAGGSLQGNRQGASRTKNGGEIVKSKLGS